MSLLPLSDRLKPFTSILNFRDFGGYKTNDGAEVATGKLFRSAHLNTLSDEELAAIAALKIGLVVDLRHKPERERQPSRYPVEDEARVLTYPDPISAKGKQVAPHEAFMETRLNTAQDAHDYMMRSYSARAQDVGFKTIFKETLLHMAETGEPILVHCAAGKDRTGTLVSLIQGLLGVGGADIGDDYLLTNKAVDIDSFLEPAAKMFTKRYGREIDPEALRPMFGVNTEYLEAGTTGMGDYTTYATSVLGITPEDIDKIRKHYRTSS
ncbi:protein tyrosine/serine phosphatase [Litorimonas taeanensis]|uniref:Protein tyrosine/serine phosphatase n=1 Tax=Litorimonas taeanensis TaxID=568099 RepID=A0A420WM41_9PROT|nr:tyrosine-protein phosphatase [Litorimonas taeanensis]RKQ72077.1 protein tyrosine/serine phosphatase [Litorimonas taeanensis]